MNILLEFKLDIYLAILKDCDEIEKTKIILGWGFTTESLLTDIVDLSIYDLVNLYNQVSCYILLNKVKSDLESISYYQSRFSKELGSSWKGHSLIETLVEYNKRYGK